MILILSKLAAYYCDIYPVWSSVSSYIKKKKRYNCTKLYQGLNKKTGITSHIFNRGNLIQGNGYTGDRDCNPNSRQWGNSRDEWEQEVQPSINQRDRGRTQCYGSPGCSHQVEVEPYLTSPMGAGGGCRGGREEICCFSLHPIVHFHYCLPMPQKNQEPVGRRGQKRQLQESVSCNTEQSRGRARQDPRANGRKTAQVST